MHGESGFRRVFFLNARKRPWRRLKCWETKHWCRFESQSGNNEKERFVSTAGHSKLKKRHLGKSLAFFLFCFPTTCFSQTSRRQEESMLFLGEEFGSVARLAQLLVRMGGFAVFRPRQPVLVRSSVLSGHETARFGKNASSGNKTEKMPEIFSNAIFFCSLEGPTVFRQNLFSLLPFWPSKRHQHFVSQRFGLRQSQQCFVS